MVHYSFRSGQAAAHMRNCIVDVLEPILANAQHTDERDKEVAARIAGLERLIHDLIEAFSRLDRYGYINPDGSGRAAEDECEHWKNIAREAIAAARHQGGKEEG